MFYRYSLSTDKEGMYKITPEVREAIKESGVKNGICMVYCPHTTAAITINENADPDVCTDMLYGLNDSFPDKKAYRHIEGNSAAHLKSSCVGASELLIIEDGKLALGTWQRVYFCEFDGPRSRRFYVKIIEG
ncbi:MAG: secondary thiamine-phosphate synthase enzyme YjbQ [Fastidiosipilaceae bacterium]|jgi:secondary thiamine-phosphate synthase enzyme